MQRLYWIGAGRGAMARNEAARGEGGDLYVSCRRWSDVVGDVASGSGAGGGGGGSSSSSTMASAAVVVSGAGGGAGGCAGAGVTGGAAVRIGIDIGGVIIKKM